MKKKDKKVCEICGEYSDDVQNGVCESCAWEESKFWKNENDNKT